MSDFQSVKEELEFAAFHGFPLCQRPDLMRLLSYRMMDDDEDLELRVDVYVHRTEDLMVTVTEYEGSGGEDRVTIRSIADTMEAIQRYDPDTAVRLAKSSRSARLMRQRGLANWLEYLAS